MRKWIALAAVAAVLVTAGGAWLLVGRLNTYIDENRGRITQELGAALGRKITFDDMRISVSGGVGLRIDDLHIADDPRLSAGDFVHAERVYVKLRLLPVLLGRVEIATVAIDAPEITIIETGTGVSFDSVGRAALPVAKSRPSAFREDTRAEPKPPILAAATPVLSSLSIRDARIRYEDRRVTPAVRIDVDRLDLTAFDLGSSRPVRIEMSASLFGASQKNVELSGFLGPLTPGVSRAQMRVDLDLELGPIAVDDLKRWDPLATRLPAELSSSDPIEIRGRSKGTLEQATLELSIDASAAAVRYGSMLDKPAGVPARLDLKAKRRGTAIEVESAKIDLATIEISASGRVRAGSVVNVDLDVEVPTTELTEWQVIVSELRGLKLGGQTEAHVHLSGPLGETHLPFLKGTIALRDVTIGGTERIPSVDRLTTDLTLEGDLVMLPETRFSLGGAPVAVRATARNLAQPVVEFTARAAQMHPQALGFSTGDAADLLREVHVEGEARRAPSEARMTVRSESGHLFGVDYEGLEAEAATGDGVVELSEVKLRAYGGNLTAKGLYHHGSDAPIFELRAAASDMLIGSLLASRGSPAAGAIEGRLRGELNLRGAGRQWPSIRDTLRGSGHVALDDGVLRDMNVGRSVLAELTGFGGLSELVSPELREKYPRLFATNDTPFEELAGSVTIADARWSTGDVTLRAPDYGVRAAGWFDLDRRLDLSGRLVLSKELTDDIVSDVKEVRNFTNDARRLEIPFRLRGDFPEARPEPDAEPIARALRRALLGRGAGELIGGERDGAKTPEELEEGLRQLFGR